MPLNEKLQPREPGKGLLGFFDDDNSKFFAGISDLEVLKTTVAVTVDVYSAVVRYLKSLYK